MKLLATKLDVSFVSHVLSNSVTPIWQGHYGKGFVHLAATDFGID